MSLQSFLSPGFVSRDRVYWSDLGFDASAVSFDLRYFDGTDPNWPLVVQFL